MDVDNPSFSSRLSVLCSTSAEYSSNSSEGSSPNSRRSSMNESIIKDESYWERRRKNNDASRRSREKRRLGDMAMEQKLMQLSAENERLKNQLENRSSSSSSVGSSRDPPRGAVMNPAISSALGMPTSSSVPPSLPMSSVSGMPGAVLPPLLQPAQQLPMLQLAQLQAAFQQQSTQFSAQSTCSSVNTPCPDGVRPCVARCQSGSFPSFPPLNTSPFQYQAAVRPSCLFSTTTSSAFTPFHKDSVIMRPERTSPDSSSDRQAVIRRAPSPIRHQHHDRPLLIQQPQQQPQQAQPSLLGALLSTRRTSPTVPQSRTEHISGLGSPPRSSKSDCESISSSASFSPSHSSEDQIEDAALRQALGDDKNGGSYVDRRRRNNEAAKRCRANRRAVFEYRSRRVQLLENENEHLKEEIDRLKKELEQQRALLSTITREGL